MYALYKFTQHRIIPFRVKSANAMGPGFASEGIEESEAANTAARVSGTQKFPGNFAELMFCSISVSYTHLDVYKRQQLVLLLLLL